MFAVTPCMPCSFGPLPHPRSEPGGQPNGLRGVTVTDRCIPLVTAAYGTRVARPARTTRLATRAMVPMPDLLRGTDLDVFDQLAGSQDSLRPSLERVAIDRCGERPGGLHFALQHQVQEVATQPIELADNL
jgi:hypothetical protein